MEKEYTYDGQFDGNILVVGRTGCGKTTFIEKLGKNKLFGSRIKDVFWVSKIVLSEEREELIRERFVEKSDYVDSELGENFKINKLIVMDDVSGLADRSNKFQTF